MATVDNTCYIAVPATPDVQNPIKDEKKSNLFCEQENPFYTASIFSTVTCWWLQPLVSLGAQKVLEQQDVWPISSLDQCATLEQRFHYPPPLSSKSKLMGKSGVAVAILKTFQSELLWICINYTIYIITMVLQTFIARAILNFLNNTPNVFHIENGYVLVLLMAIVSFIGVTCLNYGFFLSSYIGVKIRSIIMNMVYQKALRLSSVGRQSYTTGEIVTLMSVDSDRIFNFIIQGPWLGVAPLAFVITILLIALLFNIICAIAGSILLITMLWTSIRLADHIGTIQDSLLSVVDERVKVTSEALQGIRVMKFYAWEESIAQRVEKIRTVEVSLYRRFHMLNILNTTLLYLTPVLLGGVVWGLYIGFYGAITITETYMLIAVVNISRLAVCLFPIAIASMSQAAIAFRRMDDYMESDELCFLPCEHTKKVTSMISISNASFTWSSSPSYLGLEPEPEQSFKLKEINLEIQKGSLVMIIGTVGSGKTSLLHALLGEMIVESGSFHVNGSVSYVSQETWIQNRSVQENILFQASMDQERYQQVLEATQLIMDLNRLPDGDQTEIGERGINLSGGQKARVAIARAIYHQTYEILVLDDPLSAVDPHVAHAIFDQCIMGLAREKTRILVLNSHYDLLQYADQVIVMQDGCVIGDGTYTEVLIQCPELKQQTNQFTRLEQDVVDEHVEQVLKPSTQPTSLIQEEDRVKGKVRGSTYRIYFDETGYNGLLVVFLLTFIYSLAQGVRVLVDLWQGYWAKQMTLSNYSGLYYGIWYCILIIGCAVLILFRGVILIESCIRSAQNLHNDLFRRVLYAPIHEYFDITPIGRILNRFTNDLDQLDMNLPLQYQNLFQSLVIFMGCFIICGMTSIWVTLSYIPMLCIFIFTGYYFKLTSRELKRLEGVTRSPIFNLFSETLNGLHTIRAFQMQSSFIQLIQKNIDINTSYYFHYWAAGRWLAIRLDWLSVFIIVVVSLYLVLTKGSMDPILAGISITYSLMLTSLVQWCVRSVDMTDNAMTSVERLLHFREIPMEKDASTCLSINNQLWPVNGAIRFESLYMKYRPELPLVLCGVNMSIQGGEKIGICGRTGAGKSSLMIALFRICDFESGTIYIDDIDIGQLKRHDLRRALAIIPQDPVLYSGTLRENLDPFHEYNDDVIWTVLRQIHIADVVKKWGSGLSFMISERGENVSVGQRQLLCIGRALLKNSKIVVLDEATANIDTFTDQLIQRTIQETFQTKTVLIIAHRIHTILHCDQIAVMESGRVVEYNTPKNLLNQSDSIFATLAAATQV